MNSANTLSDSPGTHTAITIYATTETLRTNSKRRKLRMTGLADRLREAAGT